MDYKIKFTYIAEQDLREIAFSILQQSKNLETAINFEKRLRKSVEFLDKFPDGGSNPRDRFLINLNYKFIEESGYLLFYKKYEDEKIVRIMAVLNGKQQYVKLLKRRLI